MFERFTVVAREVVVGAQSEAQWLGHDHIGTEHLLLAVLRGGDDVGSKVLAELGVRPETARTHLARILGPGVTGGIDAAALNAVGIDLDAVRRKVEESFGPGALDRGAGERCGRRGNRRLAGHLPFSARAKKALELALREAQQLHHNYIGSEHILLGLLREGGGLATRLLVEQGVAPDAVRERVLSKLRPAA
ncbi:MAG: Clp protease N-terminal domain-containing protein [Sciscionella sp.]